MPNRYSFELATRPETVAECQRLRYQVFALEMGASLESAAEQVDADPYDAFCRHLVVRERAGGAVVACTRVLSDQDAAGTGGFYAQTEFDLGRLHALPGRKLEVGRTCVHADHRGGGAIARLWLGLAEFMLGERYDHLFGCASVDMRDGGRQARLIYRSARERGQVNDALGIAPRVPLPDGGAPAEAAPIDLGASVRRLLPPLLKAYLNLGAEICGAPAWDRRFNVADMFVLVGRANIAPRYARRFLRPAGQPPAERRLAAARR